MRTPVLIVSMLIVVLGLTYLVILAIGPQEQTIVQTKYVTQTPPQTVVVTHDQEYIRDLRSQVDNLERQLQQQRLESFNREQYYRDYYSDYYDRDEEYDLTVYVEDRDGDPIEDARVEVENDDREVEYTDRDGEAEFRNLEEDCYDIQVEADGYDDEYDDICLRRDRSITIELRD